MSENDTKFCSSCGKNIPANSEFCPSCGAHQNGNGPVVNNESSNALAQDSSNQKSAWGVWLAVGWIFFAARFVLTDYATILEAIAVIIGITVQVRYREHKYAGMALWIITLVVSAISAVVYYQ
ncbi:membrane protein [Lactobacillus phage LBR48]|uniref:Putative membrane protein n=1 Tax=Lactobacillus phage LBR48 TaxID=755164 RepID=D6PSS7_9CAUD|nr:zinc ribbon domain-containing protein [Levilactobacillus brevis]YP_009168543.1 membrane protein [Lactobacillus phage LBR48]ADF83418.1 putative membrane protein [Lactobacillus phage LBR48]ODP94805.1 hypothetical protein BGC39_10690 [Levilactobacillus brevis]